MPTVNPIAPLVLKALSAAYPDRLRPELKDFHLLELGEQEVETFIQRNAPGDTLLQFILREAVGDDLIVDVEKASEREYLAMVLRRMHTALGDVQAAIDALGALSALYPATTTEAEPVTADDKLRAMREFFSPEREFAFKDYDVSVGPIKGTRGREFACQVDNDYSESIIVGNGKTADEAVHDAWEVFKTWKAEEYEAPDVE